MTPKNKQELEIMKTQLLNMYITLVSMEQPNKFKECLEQDLMSSITWIDIWIKKVDPGYNYLVL